MRAVLLLFACLALATAAGCMPSADLPAGVLDDHWQLTYLPWDDSDPRPLELDGKAFPTRWVVRRTEDPAAAEASLATLRDRLEQGAPEVEILLSTVQADRFAEALAQARDAVRELADLADIDSGEDRQEWAALMARVISRAEATLRVLTEGAADPCQEGDPLMQGLMVALDQRADRALLGELSGGERAQLRTIVAQGVLKVGYAWAGRQLNVADRRQVIDLMVKPDLSPEQRRADLQALLAERIAQAPPAPADAQLPRITRIIGKVTPRVLKTFEAFLRQWDRVDQLSVELRTWNGNDLAAAALKTRPGHEVTFNDTFIVQPTFVLRGHSRVLLLPEADPTGETTVLFDNREGSVEMRFEGIVLGLVKAFVLPLDDARLRELRFYSHRPATGTALINLLLFMDSTAQVEDPRRIIAFQDVEQRQLVRRLFDVHTEVSRDRTAFNYLTPGRRYYYQDTDTNRD